MEIKTQSCIIVTKHSKVIAMKENLELSVAMKELADNKLTMDSNHDSTCRTIESMREGLRAATFAHIGDKLQLAQVLHSFKGNLDHGET
jgi:hypothetical protein